LVPAEGGDFLKLGR